MNNYVWKVQKQSVQAIACRTQVYSYEQSL